MARFSLVVAAVVLGFLLLHDGGCHLEVNPLSFLKHDRVTEKRGERIFTVFDNVLIITIYTLIKLV